MRKIGYLKFKGGNSVKEGIYEYVISPETFDIGIINPVMTDGYERWETEGTNLKYGYKEGETGWWVRSKFCEILPVSPAIQVLYGYK